MLEALPVTLVGIVATAYMTAVNLGAERMRMVRGSMLNAIGTFVIPEPIRSLAVAVLLHFLAGIAFTAVYAYIFDFLEPERLTNFLSIGILVGLVHGFFVSYFMMLGFSALQPGESVRPFTFTAAFLNVAAHVVFGGMVGLGLGYATLTGTAVWFTVYSLAALVAAAGLAALLLPPLRRFRPSRGQPATERGL